MAKSTGMILDGIFGSEAIDSSGEVLDVEGADISDLEEGRGVLNYEHKSSEDKGNNGQEIVGRILWAKKIFARSECETDRQRHFWDQIRLPYIYGVCRLYDGAGHEGAKALAAQVRDHHANNEPILVRFSVEGSTLEQSGHVLKRSVIRRVALTLKPCNKTANSGLLEDPNAPEGFDKSPEKSSKDILADLVEAKKFEHPGFMRLGASISSEYVPYSEHRQLLKNLVKLKALQNLKKTLTAGGLGGALVREDQSLHKWKKEAVEVFKKYRSESSSFEKSKLVELLKNHLPEASDDFIDRFADLAEDYTVKLRKDEGATPKLKKPKLDPKPKAAPKPKMEATPKIEIGQTPLTIRGKPVTPTAHETHFDESTGVLHTPRGSFPMYIPSKDSRSHRDSFHKIMEDPKVNEFHNYAMKNWSKVNGLLKEGKLPPEVVMHATLFSQLSPNTPVPMQELMYGHLVDTMKDTGIDARSPKFSGIRENWMARDTGTKMPDQSTGHFEKLGDQIRVKSPKGTFEKDKAGNDVIGPDGKPVVKRNRGELQSFMLANNKFKNMEQYHTLHNSLVDLVNRHKDDARSAVAELMQHKYKAGLHDAVRNRHLKAGKPDPGPYTAGPSVPGLAPKTARYTYGMLGGGNVHVPDTHFVRYLFGLEKARKGSKGGDNDTIDYLKNVLWNDGNTHVLDGIDRYYAKHHDAVKHMMQHPQFKHLFSKPEDAVFPAFWKNWVGIVPHEQARGMATQGFNEFTDHRPFWETIDPYLKKNELDETIPYQTAKLHQTWVKKYGELPALMLYYRHIVPHLLGESEARESRGSVLKMESLVIDLKKAVIDAKKPAVVDSKIHGVSGISEEPEHQDLVHGLDLSGYTRQSGARVNHNGKSLFLKADEQARTAGAYQAAAKHVFRLGHYLPTTTAVHHPHDQHMVSVSEAVPGAEHYNAEDPNHDKVLQGLSATGDLDKLALMDMIMGNNDRHSMNYLLTFHKEPHVQLIDHSELNGLHWGESPLYPHYIKRYAEKSPEGWAAEKMHPDTAVWLMDLDPKALEHRLHKAGLEKHEVDEATRRLVEAKAHVMQHGADKVTKGSVFFSPFQGK